MAMTNAEIARRFRQRHPERSREIQERWKKRHPEKEREQNRKYAQKKREKLTKGYMRMILKSRGHDACLVNIEKWRDQLFLTRKVRKLKEMLHEMGY